MAAHGFLHLEMAIKTVRKLQELLILVLDLSLQLVETLHEILLMDRVVCSLFNHLLQDRAKSETLIVVSLNLLLELFRSCALDVLTKHFELFVTLQNLVLELADLLFEGHYQESFLLVLLRCLSKWQ